ncbi:hypothetical protein D9613_012030 [Agrocybe pediades]|uniref:Nephrocystin 3-like N-terminal domain-containing protein n=1 Tax=Agrocybe pediades TaxID=84607 RepID=A0A8H4QF70_9AGAR|nr:hypothetical protein D9613_012030 [Agrocybe pediades]
MLSPAITISNDDIFKTIHITGGQFSQYNYHGQASLDNKAAIEILTDTVAPSAFHDSGARFDPPKCHPWTRVKVFEKIMGWILGRDEETAAKPFLKSAIAQSTIEPGIEQDLLLAIFFFSRADPSRNHAGPLIATLAYELYCAFSETEVQTIILSAIKKELLIFKRTNDNSPPSSFSFSAFRAYLSDTPFTHHRLSFVVVIDGLDECVDHSSQKAILTGLADSVRQLHPYIRILVVSRPEHGIKLSFGSKNLKGVHDLLLLDLHNENEAGTDIKLYLCERFAQVKDEFDNRTSGRNLDASWPGEEYIQELVAKSSGQFIYAATVVRYVESTRHRPDHRLDIVLNLRAYNGLESPFAQLDALYTMILGESASDINKALPVLSLHVMDSHILWRLLEIIVLKDPQWPYMRDHRNGILLSMLNHELQQYNNHAALAWVLLIFYYLGSHRFVPIIKPLESHFNNEYSIPPGIVYDPSGSFIAADTLLLEEIGKYLARSLRADV